MADVKDTDNFDESWNDAVATLQKSLNGDVEGIEDGSDDLEKSEHVRHIDPRAKNVKYSKAGYKKKRKSRKSEDDDIPEDEEEGFEEDMGKSDSFAALMSEDDDASESMDAVPFLKSMVRNLSTILEDQAELIKSQADRLDELETLTKSHAHVTLQTAKANQELKKSFNDYLEGPVMSSSAKVLKKSRFEADDEGTQYSGREVLAKSHEWLLGQKIDTTQAGIIERRVNKGTLFAQGDVLDSRVKELMKEAK